MTKKQQKIVVLMSQGMKNREIADRIGSTEFAIKNHIRCILDELGFHNRVEVALWFVKKEFDALHL